MQKVKVGDIYWDCAYHPVLCTESCRVKNRRLFSYNHDVAGVSLFDGSRPRSCSIEHCGVIALNADQVAWLIEFRDDWLAAEEAGRGGDRRAYEIMLTSWDKFVEESSYAS
jgi:hypothetical protein